jgi:membrane-bound ClpP family serine protease
VTVYLTWAIVLLLGGLALFILEAFVPSAGALGTLAVIAVLAGVGLAYYSGPLEGTVLLLTAVVATPFCIYLALKWWPNTPLGRRVLLKAPDSEEVLPDNQHFRSLRELVGKVGKAKSLMLPSGAIVIDGRVIDAVSEGMAIEAGQSVKVVEVRANRVVVRPLTPDEEQQLARQQREPHEDDLLSRPIDTLGLDPFDDAVS